MKHIPALLSIIFISTSLFAQNLDKTRPPEPEPAPEINIGKYSQFTLENGLKVFVVENHKIPKISYSISFDYDPILEKEIAGYTSITGHLMGTATESRTKEEIDKEKDFIGATISARSSGVYASALTKHNEKLLELTSDIVLNAKFKQEELDKIKKQSLSAIKDAKNDPKSISSNITNVLFYGKEHPYGEIETEESIENVTLEMCQQFYNTYYRPNIAYMAIVGDITPKEAQEWVEKYFGKWQSADVPKYSYETPQAPEKTKIVIFDRPEAVQSIIKVGYPVELLPGSADYIKASVMNVILGGSGYRLFENLREKHGWTYGAYSRLSSNEIIGNFIAYTDVRNEVTDSAIVEILAEMKRLTNEPVLEEELQRVKNYMSGNFALSLESPQTVASFAINTAKYNLPEDYYANYLKNIEAVTISDIQEISQKYLKPDNAYVFIVGKAKEIADKLNNISDGDILYVNVDGDFYDPKEKMSAKIPDDMNAEKILKNYIDKIGGEKAVKKIKSAMLHYSMGINELTFSLDLYHGKNNMYAQVVKNNGIELEKRVYDGKNGFSRSQAGKQPITGIDLESLKQNSQFIPQLNYLKNDKIITSIEEIIEIENVQCYKVKIELSEDFIIHEYYDIQNFMKIASTESYDNNTQSLYFKDYKEFNGILIPTSLTQKSNNQEFSISLKSVEINKPVNTDIFK